MPVRTDNIAEGLAILAAHVVIRDPGVTERLDKIIAGLHEDHSVALAGTQGVQDTPGMRETVPALDGAQDSPEPALKPAARKRATRKAATS